MEEKKLPQSWGELLIDMIEKRALALIAATVEQTKGTEREMSTHTRMLPKIELKAQYLWNVDPYLRSVIMDVYTVQPNAGEEVYKSAFKYLLIADWLFDSNFLFKNHTT